MYKQILCICTFGLVRGVRAYNFHSNTNYNTAEERFQDISEGGSTSNFM